MKVMAQYLPLVAQGFLLTVVLALLIVVAGLALGLFLALTRSFGIRPLNWLIIFLVDLFRALPPLVIIVLLFFGLPAAGLGMSGFAATWLSLTLVLMAFSEEIFWAGLTSVQKGQWRPRAPPASASCRRCAMWCCRRRCASPSRR
ncbi:ABC transporter permease subunit [Pseudoroseomonas wenyumeiae]